MKVDNNKRIQFTIQINNRPNSKVYGEEVAFTKLG